MTPDFIDTDDNVYERRSMGGGQGYTAERLRAIWSRGLQVRVVRQMNTTDRGPYVLPMAQIALFLRRRG